MLDLLPVYDGLSPPSRGRSVGTRFTAVPIEGYERHRIGKDAESNATLLISVAASLDAKWPAPIVLEHLSVQHDVECRITQPGGTTETGRFTLVRCRGGDRMLDGYFLRIAGIMVALLGDSPSDRDVNTAIERLVQLFRAMAGSPRKSVQGLWAELLLITRSRDPRRMVGAWHVVASDRYDFSQGAERLEVKSAAGRTRQHHFSLDQLLPIPGTDVLIVSMLVERAGAGASVAELANEVRGRVGGDVGLVLHVHDIVLEALGTGWRAALEERFDRQLAESSMSFYEPEAIPRVDDRLPSGVSDVHFRVDLTRVPTADLSRYAVGEGLLRSVVRR
jgi:hypothetical protein